MIVLNFQNRIYHGTPEEAKAPHSATRGQKPLDSFVLCRDEDGCATALYGNDIWEFSSYQLIPTVPFRLDFSKFVTETDNRSEYAKKLISEGKYLIFCLIYYSNNGALGRISLRTVKSYFDQIKRASRFCYENKDNPFFASLSLQQLLSNADYYRIFYKKNRGSSTFLKNGKAILSQLANIGRELVGFSPVKFEYEKTEYNQHPVIPSRIYFELFNSLNAQLTMVEKNIENLLKFNDALYKDEYFAILEHNQMAKYRNKHAHTIPKECLQPNFHDAIQDFNLSEFLTDFYAATNKQHFEGVIKKIQYVMKQVIHLYTGMRDKEVLSLQYDCILKREVSPAIHISEVSSEPSHSISLISTTTKLEGHAYETKWLATPEVERAVKVLQKISNSLVKRLKKPPKKIFLFLGAPRKYKKNDLTRIIRSNGTSHNVSKWCEGANITSADYAELIASDPDRDFSKEQKFKVGKRWPLTTHQYRRSLAYYGAASGLITLPTLKKLFKHTSLQMARYYTNGFENILSVFGHFNSEKNRFEIPEGHIIYQFQTVIPIQQAEMIYRELLAKNEPLFGRRGSYIEKNRKIFQDNNFNIAQFKSDTKKRVENGEISYRRTLLGGCMKNGPCDQFMLGNFTACLECSESSIDEVKVDLQVAKIETQIINFQDDSGEHQILKSELVSLTKYQNNTIVKAKERRKKNVRT